MKKMKKFAALLLAVSMAAGMVACGSSDKKEETTKKEETKKDDKETKKLEGTLKVVTTGDAYQPLFDKFTEEVGPKVESEAGEPASPSAAAVPIMAMVAAGLNPN